MKCTSSLLVFALVASLITPFARAEETNSYPKSNIEIFEATTGTVIIRSVDEIGNVAGKIGGGVTVKCREAREPATNRREFAVMVIVTSPQGGEDTTFVDFDEIDALIQATDYVRKVDWSVTSMGLFEAAYTTRSGLKVASYSSSRTGLIEAFVLSNRYARCRGGFSLDQLSRFHTLLEQARARIEVVQREK